MIHHDVGEVNIVLHLPEKGPYAIHAKRDSGNVNSDFPGQKQRTWWLAQRASSEDSPGAPKLNMKVVFGDILILKTRVPKPPDSLIPAAKAVGS